MTGCAGARPIDRRWTGAVLALGAVLRVALALVNREANDPHLPVIQILADEGRVPGLTEVWEAFQPKLYHVGVALVWRLLALQGETARVLAAQLVSVVAGIATVAVLRSFLHSLPLQPGMRLLVFALVALNPGLVAISAQATNDATVIVLGAVTVAAAARFFATQRRRDFWTTTLAAALAMLAKGNGVALPLAVLATFVVELARGRRDARRGNGARRTTVARAAAFAGVVVATAAHFGPYVEIHRRYGSAFANPALPNVPPPRLVEKTEIWRPGVRSVSEALLTFRLADMLAHPMTSSGDGLRELHRTSLWSQLYGRAAFSRFASYPPGWATAEAGVQWLGRALLLLGLVPALLLAVGLVRALSFVAAVVAGRTPADGGGCAEPFSRSSRGDTLRWSRCTRCASAISRA